MPSVVLYVTVVVSIDTIILLGSDILLGAGESKMASNGGGGAEDGRLAGKAGTGGKLSRTFNEGRRLGVGLGSGEDSVGGTGGHGRVGRDGVLDREATVRTSPSSSSRGSGGNGGLCGGKYSLSSSSGISLSRLRTDLVSANAS